MAKEGKEINEKKGGVKEAKRERRTRVNNEEIKREKALNEQEKRLTEKETELEKKRKLLEAKEEYLGAAKVVKEVTEKVKGIRYWVIIVLIIGAVSVAIGEGLWFYRIPAMERRIDSGITALGQRVATAIGTEQVSEYQFAARSEKTGDEKGFVFDTKEMEGRVFTSGISGSKNLYVGSGDTVVITLTDTESNVVLEKTFKEVQPGDVLDFLVKGGK